MNLTILILGLLTAFGPLSIDMYLPALPGIAKDFAVPLASVQLSLASFLVGIALGQIFYGPITDRWGRKKPLYVGLITYALASFACASTFDVNGLIFYRFMQALGACAGMVITRAMVRDLYQSHESAKVFSLLMLIMGVAPILAPVMGGILTTAFGWRSIFWILTVISLMALFCVYKFLPETHKPDVKYGVKDIFRNYIGIFKDKNFTGYTLSMSLVYAGMFAYITGSPFVFIDHYGLTPAQYAWVFGANACGLITFSQINGRILRKHPPEKILVRALPFVTIFGVMILIVGLTNGPIWAMCGCLFLIISNMGLIAPNTSACALAHQKKHAGSASALMGTIQFAVAGIISSLVSHFHNGTILTMTAIMCICGVLSYLAYLLLVKRRAL
ncbi:Bcr/CflA family multidrug efflux MFS transporter [Peredibacter starrii]|uniref:Bcr/CflA family multidrug efflux MFS transporter n=1 Tax=Peredibacter starrii TaxID=28202 RepID=A0AAX4HLL4_9BACT|nr:Bcr/CflA family multidrug efflux MFS transporter [Peredibacter starrii]WPU64096.1 Bcr/CflA family multidrug efflux MFS transporter [Peredibacter starrii]